MKFSLIKKCFYCSQNKYFWQKSSLNGYDHKKCQDADLREFVRENPDFKDDIQKEIRSFRI